MQVRAKKKKASSVKKDVVFVLILGQGLRQRLRVWGQNPV